MVVYTSDRDGVYVGAREARESPREPGVPVLTLRDSPAPPPRDAADGHVWRLVDGEWVETIDNRGVKYWVDCETRKTIRELGVAVPEGGSLEQPQAPPPTLADVKALKLRSLAAAYAAEVTAPIQYGGFTWNGDERALQALESAIRLYAESGVPEGYERWDIENILRPMDYDGLLEMRRIIDGRAASLAVTFRQRKDAVVGALSAEMVSLVVW